MKDREAIKKLHKKRESETIEDKANRHNSEQDMIAKFLSEKKSSNRVGDN